VACRDRAPWPPRRGSGARSARARGRTGADVRQQLDAELDRWLARLDDEFLPAYDYLRRDGLLHYSEVNNPVGRSSGPDGQWFSTMEIVENR
jgi:hypothetical protein